VAFAALRELDFDFVQQPCFFVYVYEPGVLKRPVRVDDMHFQEVRAKDLGFFFDLGNSPG
jgi:hypothetical protein